MITNFGPLGSHLKTIKKVLTSANFKKGITNLKELAEDEAKKLINRKKKEGYSEQATSDNEDKKSNKSDSDSGSEDHKNKRKKSRSRSKSSSSSSSSKSKSSSSYEGKEENKRHYYINKIDHNTHVRLKRRKKKKKNHSDSESEEVEVKHRKEKYPGFLYPMLARPFEDKKKLVKYPCYIQPKLDGVRCIAIGNELYSRNGYPFPTFDHIKAELCRNTDNLMLDGELYTGNMNFQKLSGLVQKTNLSEADKESLSKIYYNVFDYIDVNAPMYERYEKLSKFFQNNKDMKHIRQVLTEECNSEAEVYEYLDKYTKMGYEGVIVRLKNGKYDENHRSNNLQKLKKFQDAEFEIIDYFTPNKGKEVGCVVWVCKTKNGKKFNARPLGSFEDRKTWFENGKDYIGKMLTVRFQELTPDGRPRFPVGIAIRDYE